MAINTQLDTGTTPITVSEGGTGVATFNAAGNEVICAGTTSTGALQSVVTSAIATNYLKSNGAGALPTYSPITGALLFHDVSGVPSIIILTAGSAATYTPTSGTNNILVEMIGGGGAGGGGATTTAAHASAGGGGASGGYVRKWIPNIGGAYTATYTVGAGGTAGTAGANPGNTGTATTWSDGTFTLSACGGVGGAGMASSAVSLIAAGGAVGTSTGGDLNASGAAGNPGVVTGGTAGTGGAGGSFMYACGAKYNSTSNSAGVAGFSTGGGGSGALSIANATNRAGGPGKIGLIIVYEYY